METGAITGQIDVAQIALYVFWAFFAGLIYYLHQENKREGYPLESSSSDRIVVQGFPPIPAPKTYLLRDGTTVSAPRETARETVSGAAPSSGYVGSPLVPTGDPMRDGVGPASYAMRADHPDRGHDGANAIVPMRLAREYSVAAEDPDPRGMAVVGADGNVAGEVADLWIDRGEVLIRYLEVAVAGSGARVLLPMTMARVVADRGRIVVESIRADQFRTVPALASPDQVTLREEDRICAYYAGGHLYAFASRQEPAL
jgi:photosynthetic reaction center H subunit